MSNEIGDVFSDESVAEVAEVVETPEAESEASEQVEETTNETDENTKVEEESETTSEQEQEAESNKDEPQYSDNEKALYQKAKDERTKRQKFAEENEALRAELAKLKGDGEKPKRPDVFDDQEGFADSLQSDFNSQLSKAKLDVQREMMIEFKEDYVEVEQAVLEELKTNPILRAELQSAPNVAKAVYEYGHKLKAFNEAKGFDKEAYEAKIRADVKAELEKEYQDKLKQEQEKGSTLSPSLNTVRGNSTKDTEKPVESLTDLF